MSVEYYCPFTGERCKEEDCEWWINNHCIVWEIRDELKKMTDFLRVLVEVLRRV